MDHPLTKPSQELLFNEAFLRRLESLALIFRHAARSSMQGERRSSRRGQSVEFSDFRPYALGDDFRRIDWNAYARLERLFLKLFVEEEDIVLHLLLDNSASMDWGEPNKLAFSRQIAAALGYIALVGLDRVSISALFGAGSGSPAYFPALRGKHSAMRLFSNIQSISPCTSGNSDKNLFSSISARIQQPSAIILLSDLMGETYASVLNGLLGRGHQISIIHLLSPDEISPSMDGDFRLVDRESGLPVEITADFETLQMYRRRLEDWQTSWRKFCNARQIAYLPVSSAAPLEDLLFAGLQNSGVLR